MIYLMIVIAVIFCFYARLKLKWEIDPAESAFGVLFAMLLFVFAISTIVCVTRIDKVNDLKAQNINMMPTSVLESNYNEKVLQLEKVQDKIEKAFDKNQFQVQINNLNGLKIYTMPMSGAGVGFQGLGDIEKGGAEKLKLLEGLIENQKVIAEELVQAKINLGRPDYYKRNAEIMTMENSIFDGLLIKILSISNNINHNIVENRVYYPKNDNNSK